ncbi:C4-dicarboxylate ABC transporter permease [Pigmentiphaga sp. NML030171]|uniref:TRAP transporter large permease n=1 Tax=Pigmentiphaga sp. NML030171 TaxID=2008676 RepID=UPI000B41E1DB|nr:TRAP transporter large permease [Pigmentiphaga sp. NML030171]OVZ65221.1 C4-dicarboxylate ABC transporter permease [Pigmentiphaga sp. NML030171]
MSWWESLTLLFGLLSVLLLVGVPAGFAFLAINLVGALVYLGGTPGLMMVVRNGVASVTSFSLTPIPFFLLMGEVLFHTGLAMKAIDAFDRAVRRVPARLSIVAVVAGTVFSAISGATVATTALLGSLLLPEMLRRGYHPRMAMGPIMAIGAVDMLIPPSALTVLLGSLANISISGLLLAGVLPGLLLSAIFVLYIVVRAKMNPELAPSFVREEVAGWERWRPLVVHVTPLVSIFAVVVASMTAGWATPTESAALGALCTVLVCALYRSLSWRMLVKALTGTAAISGMILFIIIGATTFSQILAFSGATNGLVGLVQGSGLSSWLVLAVMMGILLVLGCFVDQISMMLMTLPFFMPLVAHFGWDPLWFGVMYLICMQLGLLTPPFGMLLFTMRSVAPAHIRTTEIFAAAVPYVLFGLLMLFMVMLVPDIATRLPRWLMAR